MGQTEMQKRYGDDFDFFMQKGQGSCYPTPPQRILDWLRTSDLPGRLRDMLRIMLNYRYSFAMAVCPLRVLAQEMGLKLRQTRYLLAELKKLHLVDVTERPGRASFISIAPLVAVVKQQQGWQEAEQPAPVETLAEVVAEPTEEELFWLQAADSSEEEPECEEEDIWEDIKGELRKLVPFEAFRNHLQDTEGLRLEDGILIVSAKPGSMGRLQEFKAAADLIIQERYLNALGVKFEPVKQKPKKLGPLARLAVAAVGV